MRYYFDIYDGVKISHDPEGLELSDVEAAKEEAFRVLSDIARSELPAGNCLNLLVTVRDASRHKVLCGHLSLGARYQ